jgi:hypothetical protein
MRLSLLRISLLLLASTALTLCAQPSTAAPACPVLSAHQVADNLIQRNLERAQALPAYRSTRTYRVDYRGFPGARRAEMVVEMNFQPPATKEFVIRSQSGSKLLIDRVFKKLLEGEKEAFEAENQRRTALNHDNYVFTMEGCEPAAAGPLYVLAVEPKVKTKFLYRGKIWVDTNDFAVVRISAEPAKNPSFWIRQTQIEQVYGKVHEFWLPATNHSVTAVRLGGRADLTIEYTDYQVAVPTPIVTKRDALSFPGSRKD